LLILAQSTGSDDEQLTFYEQVLELDPKQPEATAGRRHIWQQRGATALRKGDLDAALEVFREADDEESIAKVEELRQEEKKLTSLFDMGVRAHRQHDWEQAQRAFAEVVHLRPDYQKDGQRASWLLDRTVRQKKPASLLQHVPSWVWMLVGVLVLGLVADGGRTLTRLQMTPTETFTITTTAAQTETAVPVVAPTRVPKTDAPTITPTATAAPTVTPTVTLTVTATPTTAAMPTETPAPRPTATDTPTPSTPTPPPRTPKPPQVDTPIPRFQ